MSYLMQSQSYAVHIEHILWDVFSCERFGVGGIVNSDYIRKCPIAAMVHAATYIYANASYEHRKRIENFIEMTMFYRDWSIDDILSFETKRRVIDGIEYELTQEDGKQELEYIIKEFQKIIG